MRDHTSHDVLLMCYECHRRTNLFDLELRRQLSIECDAPINAEEDIKLREDFACRQVRSAARALTTGNKDGKIPATRVAELENILKDYYKTEIISKQLLETAARLDSKYETSKNNF